MRGTPRLPGQFARLGAVVVLLIATLAGRPAAAQPAIRPAAAPVTVALGALINLDPQGDADTQAALSLAVEDVNRYFADSGAAMTVSLKREGTGLQPAKALAGLQRLAAAGARVVVGPESSAELAAIKDEAARDGVVLISHCSTAPSLAIAGDTIFRLVPDDTRQAAVIAGEIAGGGARTVVQLWRDDVFGRDLSAATARELAARGIAVGASISFPAEGGDPAPAVAAAGAAVRAALAQGGADQVAVQLLAFGPDLSALFAAAAADPDLGAVRWVGSDGTAQSVELIQDPAAARFALRVGGLPSPLFAGAESAKSARVRARVQAASGTEPQVCALTAYDAVWLAALTALATGGTADTAALARALPPTADHYFGATGWTALNAAGDRQAADYDIWAVGDQSGNPTWRHVGHVSLDTAAP